MVDELGVVELAGDAADVWSVELVPVTAVSRLPTADVTLVAAVVTAVVAA